MSHIVSFPDGEILDLHTVNGAHRHVRKFLLEHGAPGDVFSSLGRCSKHRDGGLLYGVVEWINGNPVLDGMPYFSKKSSALEYAKRHAALSKGTGFTVEYTIINIENCVEE